ncbi:hemolysin D [Aquimarina aggregata]|uniref:Hemolysin D n=1 Tax=Aquimarina aggregata TaxID=1642818 RepID=A0A162ZDI7_9FLAO|nr:HlyD family secretion protein [Aquimarina aggregata]KZS39728.1 hemolysin D [Aquimarina aggregata]
MKIDEIEHNSERIREILAKPPANILKWGITIIFLIICIMFITTWMIQYPDIIQSQAIITTEIPPQREYAKTTGKLEALLVEDNQFVSNNQPLAIIENSANYKDVFKLKSVIDTTTISNKFFSFPIDSLPILFLGDIESQYSLFENSYIQYSLNKELKPFSNEAIANTYSLSELSRRLRNLQSQKALSKTELDFKKKELKRHKNLFEKGVISSQEYENKLLELAQAKRSFKNFESSVSQIRESISDANKISKGTEINRKKEEMILLKNVIQSFNKLKKSIKDWEYRHVLKSNLDGEVSFLNYWNANQNINQGDLVFTIIPTKDSPLIAKLKTPIENSGKIKIGQHVNIKLSNYPYAQFGILKGILKNISQIPDGDGFYIINVELPQKLITSYGEEINFKQEMSGMAEIITEDLRLIERFFYQFKLIFER